MSVTVYKGDEIFPDAMLYGIAIETVFVEVVEQICFGAVPPDSNVFVQFADVAKRSIRLSVHLVKIVKLICYFFRHLTATFFIANKPETGMPRSISIKIIDPVFKGFLQ